MAQAGAGPSDSGSGYNIIRGTDDEANFMGMSLLPPRSTVVRRTTAAGAKRDFYTEEDDGYYDNDEGEVVTRFKFYFILLFIITICCSVCLSVSLSLSLSGGSVSSALPFRPAFVAQQAQSSGSFTYLTNPTHQTTTPGGGGGRGSAAAPGSPSHNQHHRRQAQPPYRLPLWVHLLAALAAGGVRLPTAPSSSSSSSYCSTGAAVRVARVVGFLAQVGALVFVAVLAYESLHNGEVSAPVRS
jgi:hypothetical protein